jgi:hypothetical protein
MFVVARVSAGSGASPQISIRISAVTSDQPLHFIDRFTGDAYSEIEVEA